MARFATYMIKRLSAGWPGVGPWNWWQASTELNPLGCRAHYLGPPRPQATYLVSRSGPLPASSSRFRPPCQRPLRAVSQSWSHLGKFKSREPTVEQ